MGKISPVSAKYIVYVDINADGTVDKPDVIGAVFGQTEGLLGAELELRELQKNGRIGRIEVNLETKGGKSSGTVVIPSSLDMAETAIVASSLETIQRIGPCNAKLKVRDVEDVRVSKREYVVERAKSLLRGMIDKGPESAEIMDEIKEAVRALEITEFGPERLPAGPGIKEAEDLIVVEGRADVIALLRNGFKNVIGLNGTSVPPSVAELTKQKTTTAFTDGDRGGVLIVKELASVGEVDFVAQAPDGKEVEELTKKEINKGIRSRIPIDQFLTEHPSDNGQVQKRETQHESKSERPDDRRPQRFDRRDNRNVRPAHMQREERFERKPPSLNPDVAEQFKKMLDELMGTRGAYFLDESLNILGKVPVKELATTLVNLPEVSTIVMDGTITMDIIRIIEPTKVKQIVAMEAKATGRRVKVFTAQDLGN